MRRTWSSQMGIGRLRRMVSMLVAVGMVLLAVAPALALAPPREGPLPAHFPSQDVPQGSLQATSATDQEGGVILIGQKRLGIIDDNVDADVYQFRGVAGESVRIAVNSVSGGLDPTVTLFVTPPRAAGASATAQGGESGLVLPVGSAAAEASQQGQVFVKITSVPNGAIIPIPASPTNITIGGRAGVTSTLAVNLEVAIVLDVSGSIDSSEYNLQLAGVRAILDALDPDRDGTLSCSVAVVQFSTQAAITAPLSRSRAQVEAGLTRRFDDLTYYDAAFNKALEALAPSSATDGVTELVLFFSDGAPTSGTYTPPGRGAPWTVSAPTASGWIPSVSGAA